MDDAAKWAILLPPSFLLRFLEFFCFSSCSMRIWNSFGYGFLFINSGLGPFGWFAAKARVVRGPKGDIEPHENIYIWMPKIYYCELDSLITNPLKPVSIKISININTNLIYQRRDWQINIYLNSYKHPYLLSLRKERIEISFHQW